MGENSAAPRRRPGFPLPLPQRGSTARAMARSERPYSRRKRALVAGMRGDPPFLSPVVKSSEMRWDFFLYGGVITMILFFGLVPSGVCRIGVPFCFLVSRNFAFELAGR